MFWRDLICDFTLEKYCPLQCRQPQKERPVLCRRNFSRGLHCTSTALHPLSGFSSLLNIFYDKNALWYTSESEVNWPTFVPRIAFCILTVYFSPFFQNFISRISQTRSARELWNSCRNVNVSSAML